MINWGIIGLGRIARRFAKSLSYSDEGRLYAVASRTKDKRDYFSYLYDVVTYDDYDALIGDKNIDAIYIALPHRYHYIWCKKALINHKAVLCEKPITLEHDKLEELIKISRENHTFLMEGMKSQMIPMTKKIKELVDQGVIGDIKRIENYFCNEVEYNPNSYLFDKEQGGILYDCGIYNIASVLQFVNSPIISKSNDYTIRYNVDVEDIIDLEFENGVSAHLECSMINNKEKEMKIIGTKGSIVFSPFYRPKEATVFFNNGESFTGSLDYDNDDFYSEIEEVHRCLAYIEIESLYVSHEFSLRCNALMRLLKDDIKC